MKILWELLHHLKKAYNWLSSMFLNVVELYPIATVLYSNHLEIKYNWFAPSLRIPLIVNSQQDSRECDTVP